MKRLILFLGLATLIVSCNKKGCTDENASNYNSEAKEDDGSCEFSSAAQFIGTYNITTASCAEGMGEQTVGVISQGPNENQIIINDFEIYNADILATVNGNEFSYSTLIGAVGYEGTGYIVNGVVTINAHFCEEYNYPNDCTDSGCLYTYTPQ